MNDKTGTDERVRYFMENPEELTSILQQGIYAALLQHKRAGNPVCELRNGQVVWVPAEQIPDNTHRESDSDG